MRASWSLALKSAAVREANTVGSKAGASPTVATSCPVRSTMSAVRALVSPRKPRRMAWMRRASSSPNDQLEAPVTAASSSERGLQTPQDRLAPAAKHLLPLPAQVVAQQPGGLHPALPGEVAQGGQPPHGPGTEEIPAMKGEPPLGEH